MIYMTLDATYYKVRIDGIVRSCATLIISEAHYGLKRRSKPHSTAPRGSVANSIFSKNAQEYVTKAHLKTKVASDIRATSTPTTPPMLMHASRTS